MNEKFDLFGDLVPENFGRRGRPQHIATQEKRNKVIMLLAFGWNNERIASALGISEPTLRKFYFRELRFRLEMRDRLDARIAEKLMEGVSSGNISAIREFRRLLERNDIMTPPGSMRPEAKKTKPPKPGKKEIMALAARTGHEGTEWEGLLRRKH